MMNIHELPSNIVRIFKAKDKTFHATSKQITGLNEYNRKFTEPFGEISHDGKNNMILSQNIFMSMDSKKVRQNMNVFVVGGSPAYRSFNCIGPNIMQANCSYVINDMGGGLYKEYSGFLEYMGYRVRCLNLMDIKESCCYNPFNYIHSDWDIGVLVMALISNTALSDEHENNLIWEKAETSLLFALIAYLWHYTTSDRQNFTNVLNLIRTENNNINNSSESTLDHIFEQAERCNPESLAVKQYKIFKICAGRTRKDILSSCTARLQALDLEDVAHLTDTDNIDLDSIGDEKTALFVIMPADEGHLNFLAAVMYSQLFQRTYDYCENTAEFSQLVMDADRQVIRCYRAGSPEESKQQAKEAEAFLERAKNGHIRKNETLGRYELVTEDSELFGYRGSHEEAEKALMLIKDGGCVMPNSIRPNYGQCLPIHVRLMLDGITYAGKIPEFAQKVAIIRKLEMSVTIAVHSLAQIQKLYKDDWSDIIGNCGMIIYLGGDTDTVTTEWVAKLFSRQCETITSINRGKIRKSILPYRNHTESYTSEQMKTLPEDECIVMLRSMYPYRDKKYKATDHPARKLAESLSPCHSGKEKSRISPPLNVSIGGGSINHM